MVVLSEDVRQSIWDMGQKIINNNGRISLAVRSIIAIVQNEIPIYEKDVRNCIKEISNCFAVHRRMLAEEDVIDLAALGNKILEATGNKCSFEFIGCVSVDSLEFKGHFQGSYYSCDVISLGTQLNLRSPLPFSN